MLKNVSTGLIENVKDLKIALNELTVYDLNVYSMSELYYKIAHKLNEVINELSRFEGVLSDEVIKQNEKLIYLLGEGLENEVIKNIDRLIEQNFFEKIFSDLNNKIDNFKLEIDSQLSHIDSQLSHIAIYVGESNGIDDSLQIQEAIDKATTEKCKVLLKPNQVYFVKSPILLKDNVILDLNGSTLSKINTNINSKMVVNSNYNDLCNPNVNIGIINGTLIGNGREHGVSDQGSAIAIINANGVLIENIKTDNTNGDGIQWRRADNVKIRDVKIGTYGRNGISPTSGLNTVWDNVIVEGPALPGANPGKDIDAETNSATEKGTHIANNIQCRNITLVDFYNEDGAEFSQSWFFNNCKVGPDYNAFKIKSINNTNANIIINPNCEIIGTSTGGSLCIENVNGVIVNGCKISSDGTVGIAISNVVSNLKIDNVKISGCSYDIQAFGDSRLINSEISNCILNQVYLGGYSNTFSGGRVNWLRLNGEDSANTFIGGSYIKSIDLLNNALLLNQTFGGDKGTRSKCFFSQNESLKDGETYVMTIPIPDTSNRGKCFMLFAGYSYGGRLDHSASLLATVTSGKLSTSVNIINQNGDKSIEITNITQTEIELTLTYQYAGNFSVTLLG